MLFSTLKCDFSQCVEPVSTQKFVDIINSQHCKSGDLLKELLRSRSWSASSSIQMLVPDWLKNNDVTPWCHMIGSPTKRAQLTVYHRIGLLQILWRCTYGRQCSSGTPPMYPDTLLYGLVLGSWQKIIFNGPALSGRRVKH